jgi:hypothetical protein
MSTSYATNTMLKVAAKTWMSRAAPEAVGSAHF